MNRNARQLKLLEIISTYEIDTQEDLVQKLAERDIVVTQATVSRDIKDLYIIKTLSDDGKRYKYVAQQPKESSNADKFIRMFKSTVLSIRSAENIIVIKTETGSAMPCATLIDKLNFKEVLGVIAGDDTIFAVINSFENTAIVLEKLEQILQN